jgi:predicted acetyltransferase
MRLIKPNKKYAKSWQRAMAEFRKEKRQGFWNYSKEPTDINEYIQETKDHEKGKNLPPNWIPSTTFWLIDNDKFVGHVNIRHELNDHLKKIGGHIGYAIRPSARKKGYGTKILALALRKAIQLGFTKALVTCDESNIGSKKVIEKNNGQLENKVKGENGPKCRYWIKLT